MRNILFAVLFVSFCVSSIAAQNDVDKAAIVGKAVDRKIKIDAAGVLPVKSEDGVPKRAAKRQTGDDYHKFEFSGGYSGMRVGGIVGEGEAFSADEDEFLATGSQDSVFATPPTNITNIGELFPTVPFRPFGGRKNGRVMHGFNASAVYNFSQRLGVKFEVSGHYGSSRANFPLIVTVAPLETGLSCAAVGFPSVPGNACGRILPLQSSFPPRTIRSFVVLPPSTPFSAKQRHYNFLGGLQFKNNSTEKRFKPFAHALAGVSRQTVKFSDFSQRELALYNGKDEFANTGFTMSLGGGIDIRLSKRIDLRVFQLDYNPVRIKSQQILAFQQPLTNLGIPNTLTLSNIQTTPVFSLSDVRLNSRWQNNYRLSVGIVFH